MKKFKITGIVFLLLLFFSIFSIVTVFAINGISKVKPQIPSYKYIPDYYDNFIYIKDFKSTEKQWKTTDIYKTIKNNFVYLDYKYKYFDTLDNYLIKFNFNTEKLISMADGEVTAGNIGSNYFIITRMTFSAKQLLSILNILPDSPVNKLNYQNVDYFQVKKSQKELYYTKLGEHTIFATNAGFITSSIDKYISNKFTYTKELYDIVSDEEIFVHVRLSGDLNKFEIIPKSLTSFDLVLNLTDYKTSIISNLINSEIKRSGSLSYKESLKNIPADIPLCVYNSSKDIKTFVADLMAYRKNLSGIDNPKDYQTKADNSSNILNKYNNGLLFVVDSLMSESNSPNLGFMIIPDKELTPPEYKQNANDLKVTAELLLGLDSNNWTKTEKVKYIKYTNGDFSVISGAKIAGLISETNNTLSERITTLMENQGKSLYDFVYKKKSADNTNNEISLIYINNNSMAMMLEPILINYINTLNVTDNDYENSFGALFNHLKKSEPYLITLENKENSFGKVFYGNGEFVKQ